MKERKGTLWIEYHAKPVRQELEAHKGAAAEEAQSGFKVLLDALYGAIRKRNRRDGSGERAALFEIKGQLRKVYPELSHDTKPSTVASYVKRLVNDLEKSRRAFNRAMLPAMEHIAELEENADKPVTLGDNIVFTGPGLIPDPRGWKADPPAPETLKSSPQNTSTGCMDAESSFDSFGSALRNPGPTTGSAETAGVCAGPTGTVGHGG